MGVVTNGETWAIVSCAIASIVLLFLVANVLGSNGLIALVWLVRQICFTCFSYFFRIFCCCWESRSSSLGLDSSDYLDSGSEIYSSSKN